mgnify:CR=1 FL=1
MPKFDPMTGELITEETDGKGTASISENQTDIGQTTEQTGKQFVPRFDPMTGQPIHIEQSQPQTQSQFQRQLQSESQSQSQPQPQFQPRPQSQEPKKSHKMAIIVSIGIAWNSCFCISSSAAFQSENSCGKSMCKDLFRGRIFI